jgi:hypothetical protein
VSGATVYSVCRFRLRVHRGALSSDNGLGWNEKPEASTTSSSSGADDDITGGMNAKSPRWFAKNVRQVCDGAVGRPCR